MDSGSLIRSSMLDWNSPWHATARRAVMAVAMCLVLPACALLVGEDENRVVRVAAGDSFGECIGYCIRILEVGATETRFTVEGWSPNGPVAPIDSTHGTDASFFNAVATGIAWSRFNLLDERYGCPDCTDGGAEWVELENEVGDSKRVTFEYGLPPAPLVAVADTLRSIRVDYAQRLIE